MLDAIITRWGYPAIVVGTFLEGETILVLGGAMAHRGLLSLPGVMIAAFVGSVAGDQLWFLIGRRVGRATLEQRPKWRDRAARVEAWLARYGNAFVVGFRFIYGLRTVSPALLGASGYPQRRFSWLNVVGAALWATSFAGVGWGLGASLQGVLERTARWEEIGALGILLAGGAAAVYRLSQRRESAGP
jgi:membrane protein DedA with SNARE-associated domain